MKKRKSPKEIIESDSDPTTEIMFMKYPGEEPEDISRVRTPRGVWINADKYEEIVNKHLGKDYTEIHTHQYDKDEKDSSKGGFPIPGISDIKGFIHSRKMGNMVIAQRDKKTGEVMGVLNLHKKKNLRNIPEGNKLTDKERNLIQNYSMDMELATRKGDLGGYKDALSSLKNYATYRFFPAKGYRFDKSKGQFVKKEKGLSNLVLEKALIFLGAVGILIYFLSFFKITGFSILEKISLQNNLVGVILFIISLIAIFVGVLKKNK